MFHENLVKFRKLRGFSQEQLAEKVNVSRQAVSKWENAETVPDMVRLSALADVLEVSMDELCGREGYIGRSVAANKNEEASGKDSESKSPESKYIEAKDAKGRFRNIRFSQSVIFCVLFALCGFLAGRMLPTPTNSASNIAASIDVPRPGEASETVSESPTALSANSLADLQAPSFPDSIAVTDFRMDYAKGKTAYLSFITSYLSDAVYTVYISYEDRKISVPAVYEGGRYGFSFDVENWHVDYCFTLEVSDGENFASCLIGEMQVSGEGNNGEIGAWTW